MGALKKCLTCNTSSKPPEENEVLLTEKETIREHIPVKVLVFVNPPLDLL